MGARWVIPIGLLVVVTGLAKSAVGQDASGKPGPGATVSRRAAVGGQNHEGVSERTADSVKFANGLLRQRKFDLAADEFRTRSQGRSDEVGIAGRAIWTGECAPPPRAISGGFAVFRRLSQGRSVRSTRADGRATGWENCPTYSAISRDARRELETYTATANGHAGLEMAWTYLGDVLFGLNDPARAKAAYEKSISAYPNGRMADRARFGLGRPLPNWANANRHFESSRSSLTKKAPNGRTDLGSRSGAFANRLESLLRRPRCLPVWSEKRPRVPSDPRPDLCVPSAFRGSAGPRTPSLCCDR